MEKVLTMLHNGLSLDQIAGELNTSARVLKSQLQEKYPLPGLDFSIGVEIEGFSTIGLYNLVKVLRNEDIDIEFREWQPNSLVGVRNWTLTTDGSVKGFKGQFETHKGMEIVSPPLYSMERLEELKTILNTLRDGAKMSGLHNKFKVNKSCGVHVHFGVDERGEKFLKKVYTLYRIFEPFLDCMLSESRHFNRNYCKAVTLLPFQKAISDRTDKYWSIRMKKDMPTVEFRKHQGTTSYYRILYWILILQQILKKAEKIKKVSSLGKKATFAYFYKVLDNPLLIAHFNSRKVHFDEKKKEKLGKKYLENRIGALLQIIEGEKKN